jgi:urease gamma subunit
MQMRRDLRADACCPRHNEPFGVNLVSPCTLWQPVQPQAATMQRLQLASAVLGRSAAVASVRAMVKQGGSETAENDGSKLVNVAHP